MQIIIVTWLILILYCICINVMNLLFLNFCACIHSITFAEFNRFIVILRLCVLTMLSVIVFFSNEFHFIMLNNNDQYLSHLLVELFVYKTMVRHNKDNENEDIISNLTDCILIYILSFLNAKEVVQTCILSKRWINLWKSLPTLTLSSSHFRTEESFNEFLSQFLSLRDGSTTIHTLNVYFPYYLEPSLFQMIIKYIISHNVQHLLMNFPCRIDLFSSCFFSCHTLTSLNLSGYDIFLCPIQIFPKNLNLPALTSLSLKYIALHRSDDGCVEPFSTFNMLNRLTIDCCMVQDAQNLCISSTKLVNLTILMDDCDLAPNIETYFGLELYAPSLQTFAFSGPYTPKLFASKNVLSSIKHVNIHVTCYWNSKAEETSSFLLNWLVEVANIESLTLSSYTLSVLHSISLFVLFILYL